MPISFPTSPATNDEYTFGSTTWIFNGVGWEVLPATTGGGLVSLGIAREVQYWDVAPGVFPLLFDFSEKTYV